MARTKRKAANLEIENLPTDPKYAPIVAQLRAVAEYLEMNQRLLAGVKAIHAQEVLSRADIDKCARDLQHVNSNCTRIVSIYGRLVEKGSAPGTGAASSSAPAAVTAAP